MKSYAYLRRMKAKKDREKVKGANFKTDALLFCLQQQPKNAALFLSFVTAFYVANNQPPSPSIMQLPFSEAHELIACYKEDILDHFGSPVFNSNCKNPSENIIDDVAVTEKIRVTAERTHTCFFHAVKASTSQDTNSEVPRRAF